MRVYIVIPTCKKHDGVVRQLEAIKDNTPEDHYILATCTPESAAENRNLAHSMASADIVVSLDDDVKGFYLGWLTDIVGPLLEDEKIRFASARFMKPDGKSPAHMMTSIYDMTKKYEEVLRCPTSAYAYRKADFDALKGFWNETSQPFDTIFTGSGCEDDAICHDLKKKFSDTRIVINNDCKLIHLNEMKNQSVNLKENRARFDKSGRKYGLS